jgi:hypothetical protein
MTGDFYLDWAIMALSLANVILLSWSGLTVLLNAERRTWGVWLAGGGLLTGAAFFVSHTAILGLGVATYGQSLNLWWRTGWLPLVALPLAWYVMILWHAGFWEGSHLVWYAISERAWAGRPTAMTRLLAPWLVMALWYSACWEAHSQLTPQHGLRRRHRFWLQGAAGSLAMLLGLLLFASPLPSFNEAAHLDLAAISGIGGLPLLLIAFPLYIVFCTVLSLDALRHPTPAVRLMGDQARRRARPWLVAATSLLLLVSFLVSAVIVWLMLYGQPALADGRVVLLNRAVGWFDLIIETLILGAVIMVGQAIVSYEIFTGRTLPRSEFRRSWQYAIILAVGLGLAVGFSFAHQARPIYTLLLITLLLVIFYALLGWRSYTRREEYVRQLRPFLVSQRLYERLARIPLAGAEPAVAGRMAPEGDSASLFHVLCAEILGIRFAHLVAVGPLAPLVGAPLTYPLHRTSLAPPLDALISQCHSPDNLCLPLDPDRWQGLQWAVPLWNERGLIGLFLLGPKIDDGLFTQEEMEIVQVSGERLIDAQASSELSRSLMALQRQRLVESQLLDRNTRRVLHDEILPQIHSALLIVSSGDAQSIGETTALLAGVHRELAGLLREMPARGAPPVVGQGLLVALRQLLADELKDAFDDVKWNIEPQAAERLAKMPALTVEVLFYAAREAIRNAARYGRGDDSNRPLCLCITAPASPQLTLWIEDDGVGVRQGSGPQSSGQGLALHSAMLAVVGGTLAVASKPHVYTRVTLMLS